MTCHVKEGIIGRATRTITLENNLMSVTVLVDKEADIYRRIHRATSVDVLWKSPWGPREPGTGPRQRPTVAVDGTVALRD